MEEKTPSPPPSNRKLAWTFLALALWLFLVLLAFYFRIGYWLKTPQEKFFLSWNQDLAALQKSNALPQKWNEISEIKFSTDQSPAQEWMKQVSPPVSINEKGAYRLEIFIMHWIENRNYGVIIEYHLLDKRTNNTIWELGRTLNVGYVL